GPSPLRDSPRCIRLRQQNHGPVPIEGAEHVAPPAPCNRHGPPLCFTRGHAQETTMGLLDVLNGMQNGPRGPSTPSAQSDSGGMSPMTMAILALLAWKAVKHFGGGQPEAAPTQAPPKMPGNVTASLPGGGAGGGLSDMLKGGL